MSMIEEVIADREFDNRTPGLRAGLEHVRGTGLAMLWGWHVERHGQTATLTVIPQRAIRIERLMISPSSEAANWVIHDIRIGDQIGTFAQPIPGEMFSSTTPDNRIDVPAASAGTRIEVVVEYVGGNPDGAVFLGALLGRSPDSPGMMQLALNSGGAIARDGVCIAWVQLDDEIYRFEGRDDRLARIVSVLHMPTSIESLERRSLEVSPRMISLHVVTLPLDGGGTGAEEPVLIGIDDATSRVVFELGNTPVAPGVSEAEATELMIQRVAFNPRCDLAGYIPSWWDLAQLMEWDLRDPIGPPTGAGTAG